LAESATSPPGSRLETVTLITIYGVLALSFMMVMYGLERRGRMFILAFALGCLLSSVYGFLSGAWPFGVVEAIWCVVAVQRFRTSARSAG
jgi:hypothetical protein